MTLLATLRGRVEYLAAESLSILTQDELELREAALTVALDRCNALDLNQRVSAR